MIASALRRHRARLAAGTVALAAAWGGVLPFEGTSLEPLDIAPAKDLAEPSGIVYHPGRKTLFAVGDEGDVVEMTTDGVVMNARRFGRARLDLEGVTVGPGGNVYLLVEDPPAIVVLTPEWGRRYMQIDPALAGTRVICLKPGAGLEGLCYVPEQDAFYAVNQLEPARLVELDVPREGTATARVKRIVAELDDPIGCASDITWEPRLQRFLITSASYKSRPGLLWEVTLEGKVGRSRRLPGREQEGFCLDADGNAYVAQDCGGVLKCEPYRGD